jgi:two-component system, OmpR family, response regulator QseB
MRLLIIEDDSELSAVMKAGLAKSGFIVDMSNTGEDGEYKACVNRYDAIVLDLNLPDKDGIEILSYWRGNDIYTPVVIVTARDEVRERVLGLNNGADDYIVKPFDFVELEARLAAVVRRFYGRARNEIALGAIHICPQSRKATVHGREIALSAKEFDILEYLASRSPEIVSSEDIAEHVYDEFYDPLSSVLRVHIANLRKKLTAAGGEGLLMTQKGKGYRLCGERR